VLYIVSSIVKMCDISYRVLWQVTARLIIDKISCVRKMCNYSISQSAVMSFRSHKVSHFLSLLSLHQVSVGTWTDSQRSSATCCQATAPLMYQIHYISETSWFWQRPDIAWCVWNEIPLWSFHSTNDNLLPFVPFGYSLDYSHLPTVTALQDYTTVHCSSSNQFVPHREHTVSKTYFSSFFLTYLLSPWSRVLSENLTGSQLVKKFPAFYGNWRFITAFTTARHLSVS